MNSRIIKLSDNIRLRKEYFGGILFNTETGDVIEVDREAFTIISLIKSAEVTDMRTFLDIPITNGGKRVSSGSVKGVLSKLRDMGLIDKLPAGVLRENNKKLLTRVDTSKIKWPPYQYLSAPETIHWAVTFKCGEACPDCYIRRHKDSFTKELDTSSAIKLIDKISDIGVFQLAIGGGEPLMRDDLESILHRAWEKGLTVHITTGKYEIDKGHLDELGKYIKTLQVGIRTDELLDKDTGVVNKLGALTTQCRERSITTGANIIMTRYGIYNLDNIINKLMHCGFTRFTLLRYKPPADIKRWLQEKPDRDDLTLLEEKLNTLKEEYSEVSFRIDCGLSFMERELDPSKALYSGIRGCVAGDRVLSVAPDGSVYPCSQLAAEKFRSGNLLEDDFDNIWNRSDMLKKYRAFRKSKNFKNDDCGKCRANEFCGGCRVFADDAIGSDPGCPDPLYAAKYAHEDYDVIADIQDSIGFTEGGFPFASREEIERWLEEDNNRSYPDWINNKMIKLLEEY